MNLTYAVVFEKAPSNWCAYAPDVPGCVSVGDTWEEMLEMIDEALTFHIEGMLEDGELPPEPKMSIDEAIAHHIAEMSDETWQPSLEPYDFPPTVATRFEFVEIKVRVPEPVQSSGTPRSAPVPAL